MTAARDLADQFHERWLQANPFAATMYGIPGYDHLLPDDSEAGQQAWRAEAVRFLDEAARTGRQPLTPADAVTLDCTAEAAAQEVAAVDLAADEYTVTAMQYSGPAMLLAVAARTVLIDPAAAEDYLTRVRGSGAWLDQVSERLRAGAAAAGCRSPRWPRQAAGWVERVLAAPDTARCWRRRRRPAGTGRAAWEDERRAALADVVQPALRRWADIVRELLPRARPAERAGLRWLPGGDADYARAIRIYTTLAADRRGTAPDRARPRGGARGAGGRARPAARAVRPGRGPGRDQRLGREDRPGGGGQPGGGRRAAGRGARARVLPRSAAAALRGDAHARRGGPGRRGAALHAAAAGRRPAGHVLVQHLLPTAGTGWDIDVVAFHEAVPGHHLQLSRLQLLGDLPALQRQRSLPVFSEGWGLYAEQLAEETGLYADDRGLLGAVSAALMRAVRLVVDTGLHAFGWSRERARRLRGRARADAAGVHGGRGRPLHRDAGPGAGLPHRQAGDRAAAGRAPGGASAPRFSLPAFHAAVLDHGSLPMPTLARSIAAWEDGQAGPTD